MPDDIIHMRESQFRLLELLATIHRDGGHHTVKHGIEQSFRDAMKVIYEDRELNDVLGRAILEVAQAGIAVDSRGRYSIADTQEACTHIMVAFKALAQATERDAERRRPE